MTLALVQLLLISAAIITCVGCGSSKFKSADAPIPSSSSQADAEGAESSEIEDVAIKVEKMESISVERQERQTIEASCEITGTCPSTPPAVIPIPSCTLVASQTNVDQGATITITPSITGVADSFTLDGASSSQTQGREFVITQTRIFRGVVRNVTGESHCAVAVNVRIPNAPTCNVALNPTTIRIESSATAQVNVSQNYTSLLVNNVDVTSSIASGVYSSTLTPDAGSNQSNFSVAVNATITGPGGSNQCSGILTVRVPSTPSCTITLSRQTATVGDRVSVTMTSTSQDVKSARLNGVAVVLPFSQEVVTTLGQMNFNGEVQTFGPSSPGRCAHSLQGNPPAPTPATLLAWGANSYGQSGQQRGGGTTQVPVATLVGDAGGWSSIATGTHHSLGIRNGQLFSWGANYSGQLGTNEALSFTRHIPAQVGSFSDWTAVSADAASFGIRAGRLYGWGDNQFAQVGNGNTMTVSTPVQIGTFTDWTHVDAGVEHTLAIRGGRLYAWGENQHGQLGDGTTTDRSTPVQIGSFSDWIHISAGGHHSLGIRNGGELYYWGQELASGTPATAVNRSPRRIGTFSDWRQISAGYHHSLAIRSTGQLYVFGFNWFTNHGLGDGTTNSYAQPVQVGSSTTWTAISAGASRSMAINNGRLFVWGANASHELGIGNNSFHPSTPYLVSDDANWTSLSLGSNSWHSMGIKN